LETRPDEQNASHGHRLDSELRSGYLDRGEQTNEQR